MADWTKEDSLAALLEGWDIMDCDGSENGSWQIQALESPEDLPELGYTEKKFATDEEVWVHISHTDSPLHQKALAFIQSESPIEFAHIQDWVEGH